ncbi:signal recognition particle subunit Srp21p [[Candida] jaroonii]|uniref:Signal recognition particle subunit Srp21p n=1 Tax=[Candida] jaroonii TaxID=467808 RepID=A0ACA9Y7R6_9ASCO|nr:signal recognition particle subunit Srp21p [[Candida] jaroonii]
MKIEEFIESSNDLLEAFPSTTISITYANDAKKYKNDKYLNSVKIKCYEPKSGKCLKFKTNKAKELSRLLIFLGPKSISVKRKREEEEDTEESKKFKTEVPGMASIMSNKKFENDTEINDTVNPEPPASGDKKKKKKKGKK